MLGEWSRRLIKQLTPQLNYNHKIIDKVSGHQLDVLLIARVQRLTADEIQVDIDLRKQISFYIGPLSHDYSYKYTILHKYE